MKEYFSKILNWIKSHPYITAGAVFAVGLIWVFSSRGRSEQDASQEQYYMQLDPHAAEIAGANDLQLAQMQNEQRAREVSAQENVALQKIGADVAIATLQSQVATTGLQVQSDIQRLQIEKQYNTDVQVTTLQAQTAQKEIDAQLEALRLNTVAYTTVSQSNNATQLELVKTALQQNSLSNSILGQQGVNGVIHDTPSHPREAAGRAAGYTGVFGAGGLDAWLISKYGRAYDLQAYGIPNP